MGFKSRFEKLGREYLAAIEGAIGCRLDAEYTGLTFQLADLTATLQRFYENWASESEGLRGGYVDFWRKPTGSRKDFHLANAIEIPLREQCKNDPGVFMMMQLNDPERIRSILMFADAVLFWDPFEEAVGTGSIDSGVSGLGLSMLKPLRPLIAAGLVVPAQLAQTRVSNKTEANGVSFPNGLMWQGALGKEEFEKRLTSRSDGDLELHVSYPLESRGWLGHAENKVASLFLPDIVIPLMDYDSLSSYEQFCISIDQGLKAREVDYVHKSLAFETGFLLDPEKLTNGVLLDLRGRDYIFEELRSTIVDAVKAYEDAIATGASGTFIEEFNIRLQKGFQDLKAKALVSNTWKEFVDERKSLSSRFMTKVVSAPLRGREFMSDMRESFVDSSTTSVANIAVAALKTYSRYRNTKVLMDVAGAIRDHHDVSTSTSI